MMSSYPSTLQRPERFDLYAGKFRSICVMHGIKTGSSEDLEAFLKKLEADRYFAMDFWSLIGKLSDREGGELSDDQILALVVECVTGSAMSADSDPGVKPHLAELRALLAGVDVQRPEPLNFPTTGRPTSVASIEEARQRRYSAAMPSNPQVADAETPLAGPLPSQLQLAIENLEIVTRELKLRFDKLEERMARLETRFKETKERTASLNESRELDPRPGTKARFIAEPELPTAEHPSRNLFEGYSPERDRRWRKDVSLALLILTMVAAGLLWQRYNVKLRQAIAAIVREELATPLPPPLPPETASSSDANTSPDDATPVEQPAPAPTQASPEQRHALTGISTPPADSNSAGNRSASPDRASSRNRQDIPSFASAVTVAPAEMEKHLILSRVPVYPEAARDAGVEGPIVAQALISKTGVVTRVLVIEGDSRLRNAAAEAIYRRQYRPYLVHGQPVDVATTITVNFKLGG
jgi:TonB family protein